MKQMEQFLKALPKVELHFHLEGAIPIDAIWELCKKYDRGTTLKNIKTLEAKYQYKNFPQFMDTWYWQSQFIREYEDFTYIAEKVIENLINQNVKYVEITISPVDFAFQHGLKMRKIREAIKEGINRFESQIHVLLIEGISRDRGIEFGSNHFNDILDSRDLGIAGISLGGSEHNYPAKPFNDIFLNAKKNGLKTTIHAGECVGPISIWDALFECKADRVGHCTSGIQDEKLLDFILKKNIHLELCPGSNVMTKTVACVEEHPIKYYYDKGLNISINSDDPVMFNTSLYEEYFSLLTKCDFSVFDLKNILEMSIKSAWCTNKIKTIILKKINDFYYKYEKDSLV